MKKSLLAVLVGLSLTACGDGTTAQDREFIAKIKQHLKKTGDVVKVSDIHPGDWEKVCGHDPNSYSELKGYDEIINRTELSTWHDDTVWGIYFVYPENKAEFYKLSLGQVGQGLMKCIPKEYAYFLVDRNSKEKKDEIRAVENSSWWKGIKADEIPNDWVEVSITKLSESGE